MILGPRLTVFNRLTIATCECVADDVAINKSFRYVPSVHYEGGLGYTVAKELIDM
jgi:hypothetical protein